MSFKSGYISIIGRPNVGKSTLINELVGEPLAIVSSKPQTTRNKILGVCHAPDAQLLFLDTPGLHKPHTDLNDYMVSVAKAALSDSDLILFVIEPQRPGREEKIIFDQVKQAGKPYIIVVNKIDTLSKDDLIPFLFEFEKIFEGAEAFVPVSGLKKDGVERLISESIKLLPEGPEYFPKDSFTDQSERFMTSEMIREQVFRMTKEEIPYAVAVTIDEFKEPPVQSPSPPWGEGGAKRIARISATIHVEKDSQKGILIGKKGSMLKTIGEAARKKMEEAFGYKVFLKLFVRVTGDWSQNRNKLKELGYE